ncbi:hypothetical protein C8Q75DRAFT_805620 [Abortiporus biennis]|nr:hypothetical protein C8Q75DRAFT_805620 [Abortiporus biennis]
MLSPQNPPDRIQVESGGTQVVGSMPCQNPIGGLPDAQESQVYLRVPPLRVLFALLRVETMAQPPVKLPKLDNTLGALFIGLIAAAILFGITCVQMYTYFMVSMKKDRIVLRSLVAFLGQAFTVIWSTRFLDALDLICVAHVAYFFTITNYANPSALGSVPWSVEGFNIIANLNDVIIRGILIDRIWKGSLSLILLLKDDPQSFSRLVSKNKYLVAGLWFGNLAASGFSLSSSIRVEIIHNLEDLDPIFWLFCVVYSLIAIEDTVLAATLCVILWGKKTGFKRTDTQINKLMRYSIHTGVLTSMVAICIVITYTAMPHNFVFIGIYVTLPKFYLNALLATLNGRDSVRADGSQPSNASINLSNIHVSSSQSHPPRRVDNLSSGTVPAVTVLIEESDSYKSDPFHIKE